MLPDHVEAAFSCAFLTLFRHQARRMRLYLERNAHHLVGRRHFEVERLVDLRLQPRDVIIANMPSILPKMSSDPVTTGRNRKLGSSHWVRMTATARIANGGDVIDVDTETETLHALAVDPFGLRHHRLGA